MSPDSHNFFATNNITSPLTRIHTLPSHILAIVPTSSHPRPCYYGNSQVRPRRFLNTVQENPSSSFFSLCEHHFLVWPHVYEVSDEFRDMGDMHLESSSYLQIMASNEWFYVDSTDFRDVRPRHSPLDYKSTSLNSV